MDITIAVVSVMVLPLVFTVLVLYTENRKLRRELSTAIHTLTIYSAAKSGDFGTARLVAAIREGRDIKSPSPAGALTEPEPQMSGVTITQRG
jgi:hypothetical protein